MGGRRIVSGALAVVVGAVLLIGPAQALAFGGDPGGTTTHVLTIGVGGSGGGVVKKGLATVCAKTDPQPCTIDVDEGTSVSLTGQAASGSSFQGWAGDCSGTGTCTFTMTADKTVNAFFSDNPPAAPSITSPASGELVQSVGGNVPISFSASDSDTTSFRCQIGSGSVFPCSSGVNVGPLANGTRSVTVYSRDAVSNETGATRTFKVVNLADTSIGGTPAAGALTNNPATAFTFSGTNGATSFQCKLNGAASFTACPVSDVGSQEGLNTLAVRAGVDFESATYWDPTPATRSWTRDTVAPDTTLTADGPAAGTSTTQTGAIFHFSSPDGVTFECALDSDTFAACPGGTAGQASYSSLGVGDHAFKVRASDAAGNVDGSPAVRSWRVVAEQTPTTGGGGGGNGGGTQEQQTGATQQQTSTTGGSGSGQLPTTPIGPVEVVQPARVQAKVSASWKPSKKTTEVKKLVVSGVPAGATVSVTCTGGGCPRKLKSPAAKNGKVDLTKLFKKRKLKKGAVIEVRVTQPSAIGQVVRFSVAPPNKPASATLCLPPGASAAAAC